jgi:hypothetical protein
MKLPVVDISPQDTIDQADEKVEKAFEAEGAVLVAFENLNSLLGTSSTCHFFQVEYQQRQCILVVTTAAWDEGTVLTVLNILLEMRLDPDPPGSKLFFHFYSGHRVPDILFALFSDSPASAFECRACMVARFGHELQPASCQQLAAVGVSLCREYFSRSLDMQDLNGGVAGLAGVLGDLGREGLPAEPLNALIVLGCLFGELVRGQLRLPSRWGAPPESSPWPGLIVSAPAPVPRAPGSKPQTIDVVFDPIGQVLRLYQVGHDVEAGLREAIGDLTKRSGRAGG